MVRRTMGWMVVGSVVAWMAPGCGSSSNDTSAGSGGSMSSAVGGQDGTGGDLFTSASGGSGTGSGSGPEICDGIDNDGNGIIDDVDVGGDGVCDCLRIATLGVAGTWGNGDVFAMWLDDRSDAGAVSLNDAVITPALIADYQIIVAQDLSKMGRSYDASEVQALADWVHQGGGFMTLIGYADSSELVNVNTLLDAFGMAYEATPILPKNGANTVPVTGWATHPISNGVSLIGVDNGYPVTGSGVVVANEQGYDLLLAQEVGVGHVAMWGDEWITYDSEWNDHPEYQLELFWLNMLKWLTPMEDCQVPIPPPQ
ncbi:MAG: hypothetical protein KC731_03250 [Myxococcales bacterium]|nr:hypothetical protein [Myxococcales bacterium]